MVRSSQMQLTRSGTDRVWELIPYLMSNLGHWIVSFLKYFRLFLILLRLEFLKAYFIINLRIQF